MFSFLKRKKTIKHARNYDAASLSERLSGWKVHGVKQGEDVGAQALRLIVARARESFRNDPYIQNGIRALADFTVGGGVKPHNPDQDCAGLMSEIEAWMELCDWEGSGRNLYDIQYLCALSMFRDGEVLLVRAWEGGTKAFPFSLRMFPAEILDYDLTKKEPRIEQGIEFSPDGKRIAYWLKTDPSKPSVRIKANDVLHIFLEKTPGQLRGIPQASPVLVTARDLRLFMDAMLVRNQQANALVGVFTGDRPTFPGDDKNESISMEPGTWLYAPDGSNVHFAPTPQIQGMESDQYLSRMLMSVAAGLGLPYHLLSADNSRANYSSLRGSMVAFRSTIESYQAQLRRFLCSGLNRWLAEAAIFSEESFVPPNWLFPRIGYLDPQKEAQAHSLLLEKKLISRQMVIRELGYDPAAILEEIESDPLKQEEEI